MRAISHSLSLPLHGVAATRLLEQQLSAGLPPHTLMQRAGLASARLTLALAPHAQHIWLACGPGNNGGDGLEAALQLHQWGKQVTVTWLGARQPASVPADALNAAARARAAGVLFADAPPAHFDFAVDALLGLGAARRSSRNTHASPDASSDALWTWLAQLRGCVQPVLALDTPSGLDPDTGSDFATDLIAARADFVKAGARFCLTFLTLKPGLFTASGRDLAGQVWWDKLGTPASALPSPDAMLLGRDSLMAANRSRAAHASHKGSFGDVAVIGGASAGPVHMAGAALLAGRAALHAGAGRVFIALLGQPALTVDVEQPELMFRSPAALDLDQQTVVCGCGGGSLVGEVLPRVLSRATALVLDADALNAISQDAQLQKQLQLRHGRGWRTVLTPHPLEAARLIGCSTGEVQADRLQTARQLAGQYQCTVVLKGSGTVIAAPGQTTALNPTGSALLATAGTGDVLAGMVGAALAGGQSAFGAACAAVYRHGQAADEWAGAQPGRALTASQLSA